MEYNSAVKGEKLFICIHNMDESLIMLSARTQTPPKKRTYCIIPFYKTRENENSSVVTESTSAVPWGAGAWKANYQGAL